MDKDTVLISLTDKQIGWVYPDLTKSYLKQEPWVKLCQWCNERLASEGHHAIIKRRKGVKELDLPNNICYLCSFCHHYDGKVNGYEFSLWFWNYQCEHLGMDVMKAWANSIPLKIKPVFMLF